MVATVRFFNSKYYNISAAFGAMMLLLVVVMLT